MSFFFRIEVQAPLLSSVKLAHCSKQHFYVGKLVHTWKLLRFLSAKSQKLFQVAKLDFLVIGLGAKIQRDKKWNFVTVCNKSFACKLWSFFGRKGHKNNLNNTKTTSTVVYFNLGRRQKYIFWIHLHICFDARGHENLQKKLPLQCKHLSCL